MCVERERGEEGGEKEDGKIGRCAGGRERCPTMIMSMSKNADNKNSLHNILDNVFVIECTQNFC
jgi:hypothetical protein